MTPRRARTLVPLLAAVLALTAAPGPVSATHRPGRAFDDQSVLIGTYNIRANKPVSEFKKGVNGLHREVEVAGLQEVAGPGASRKSKFLERSKTWGYYRPPKLAQDPVIWRVGRFDFLGGRGFVLAKGRNLGGENPTAGRHQGTAWATVVHLRHHATGQDIAVINVHLIHGAVRAGRKWPHRPRTFRMYTDEVKRLAQLTRTERQWGRVFVLGDFNVGYTADKRWHRKPLLYSAFTRMGMESMWAGRRPKSRGTHRDALIDGVWSTYAASKCKVAYGIRHSDHFPAIATYRLDVAR